MAGRLDVGLMLRHGTPRSCIVLLMVCLATGALPARAAAAQTTIGFDELAFGTEVSSQYEAKGLKLGFASTFGQGSPGAGDCGEPQVQEGLEAPSPPNYALLAQCPGAASSGTYGELIERPRGPLSVKASVLPGAAPKALVRVVLYDAKGNEISNGEGEAGAGTWTQVTAPNPSGLQTSYVLIDAVTPNHNRLAIDDLDFEAPSPGEQPPPPPPSESPKPGSVAPTAVLSLLTPNATGGEALTLSGAGSAPGSGQIIAYNWDFNSDGKIDTSTGTNPLAHVILAPGVHTVGLTVVSSDGQSSSSKLGLAVNSMTSITLPDGGEGPCLPSLEVGRTKLLGECIQKLSGGGYVIETRQLDLNGMILTPKAGGQGVYRIKRHFGVGEQLSGPVVRVELPNTPIGDLVLGDKDLEHEPLTLEIETPQHKLTLPHPEGSSFAHIADEVREQREKGFVLMSFGAGKPCQGGSKKVGCCPPSGPTSSCATLPGGFPVEGQIVVYLNSKGQILLDVQVGLNLSDVGFEATGELEIVADPETGIELGSLKFSIPEASLKPIFKVTNASFAYYFPGDPDPNKRDTWQAKATITFGLLEQPGLEGELSFQHGQFHSAALVLTLPPPGIPVYPGIDLNKFGGSIAEEPLAFGGTIGASIASELELTLQFRYAEPSGGQLGYLGGKGSLSLKDYEIATLEGDVYSDGYTDALLQVKFGVPFGSKEPFASIEGEIGFWDEPDSGLWEAYGRVLGKIWIIEAEIAGLVNNKYVAGCGAVFFAKGLAYWSFEKSEGGVEGFMGSSCKDHLKPYKQVPLVQHTGGFVNETETESLRGRLPGAPLSRSSAYSADATIALAHAPLGEDLRINSSSGTPVVKLVSPNGQVFITPAVPGHAVSSGSQFVAALAPNTHQVIVYLASPQAGQWHIKRAFGSAPITSVEGAEVAPPPVIRTHVRRARGKSLSLAYRIGNFTAGMKVQLSERGRDSTHVLAVVNRPSGSVRFTPQQAIGRSRSILATVLGPTGVPQQTIAVGRYDAPRPFRPARPTHVHFTRHGVSATLSWGAVAGARRYLVRIRGSDGRVDTFFARSARRSVVIRNALRFQRFTATVTAIGASDLLPGPLAGARLGAVKARRHGGRSGALNPSLWKAASPAPWIEDGGSVDPSGGARNPRW